MSLADLQAEADHYKVVLPMSCLSFILILKAHIIHWYGYTAGSTLQQAIVTSSALPVWLAQLEVTCQRSIVDLLFS
jgi:hypothetical protein